MWHPHVARRTHTLLDPQYVREDWVDAKEAAMMRGLVAQFVQTTGLRQKLLMTGDQRIVYTRNDAYWGVGRDGKSGKNRLGELMVRLRLAFREGRLPEVSRVLPLWWHAPLDKRTLTQDGRCTGCAMADCYVGTMSAEPFPYCSPSCRISLGLPEEKGKAEWVEEERLAEEAKLAAEVQAAMEAAAAAEAAAASLKMKVKTKKKKK